MTTIPATAVAHSERFGKLYTTLERAREIARSHDRSWCLGL